jgi:hypothetical protein
MCNETHMHSWIYRVNTDLNNSEIIFVHICTYFTYLHLLFDLRYILNNFMNSILVVNTTVVMKIIFKFQILLFFFSNLIWTEIWKCVLIELYFFFWFCRNCSTNRYYVHETFFKRNNFKNKLCGKLQPEQ